MHSDGRLGMLGSDTGANCGAEVVEVENDVLRPAVVGDPGPPLILVSLHFPTCSLSRVDSVHLLSYVEWHRLTRLLDTGEQLSPVTQVMSKK
jgi:hypothetical protein